MSSVRRARFPRKSAPAIYTTLEEAFAKSHHLYCDIQDRTGFHRLKVQSTTHSSIVLLNDGAGLVARINGEVGHSNKGNATPKQRPILFNDDAPNDDWLTKALNEDASSTEIGTVSGDVQRSEADATCRQQQIVEK